MYLQLVFRIPSGVIKGFASDGIAKAEVRKPPQKQKNKLPLMKIVNKTVLVLVLISEAFPSMTLIPIWNPNIDDNDVVKASKSFEIMDPFDCN